VARPKSKDAVYLKIGATLERRIRSGKRVPGERLPSESEVAAEFGVARGTAREALKHVESLGLVESRPAVGWVVRDPATPTDDRPLFHQIAATLEDELDRGLYPPGTLLPSESTFEERFEVSRTTIRNALRILDAKGLVQVVHGKGRFVNERQKGTDR
jgi:DNA-binding GntR family transcriptional regulator